MIRNQNGEWLRAFSCNLGHTNNMVAELWGLRDGLHQAISLCIDMLEVEVDSKAIVELINNSAPNDFIFSSLIYDCRLLLGSFRASRLYHVYQEANKLADCLARTGANNGSSSLCLFPDTRFFLQAHFGR